jgi:hypothetical protein
MLMLLLYVGLRAFGVVVVVSTRGAWKSVLYEEGSSSELMAWLVVMPISGCGKGGGDGGLGLGWKLALLEVVAPNWGMEG